MREGRLYGGQRDMLGWVLLTNYTVHVHVISAWTVTFNFDMTSFLRAENPSCIYLFILYLIWFSACLNNIQYHITVYASSTRRWLGTLPATWLTIAAWSPTLSQEDCAWLTLVRFSSVGCARTSATEPSVQLDLESGTIWWRTSDRRTCLTAVTVSDSRWRHFHLVSVPKRSVKPHLTALKSTHLLNIIYSTVRPMSCTVSGQQ